MAIFFWICLDQIRPKWIKLANSVNRHRKFQYNINLLSYFDLRWLLASLFLPLGNNHQTNVSPLSCTVKDFASNQQRLKSIREISMFKSHKKANQFFFVGYHFFLLEQLFAGLRYLLTQDAHYWIKFSFRIFFSSPTNDNPISIFLPFLGSEKYFILTLFHKLVRFTSKKTW